MWKKRLATLPVASARELAIADYEIGYLFGEMINKFIGNDGVDYISSHGHTIFHEPENRMTCQIGNGAAIAQTTRIPVISDFRSADIALGGQGAPLASIVDRDILTEYSALVNLGGISNISFTNRDNVVAYDISPCNQILNYLAKQKGVDYDNEGIFASQGKIYQELVDKFLEFEYFNLKFPKSLDNNAIREYFFPLLDSFQIDLEDKLASGVELIALTLSEELQREFSNYSGRPKVLLTGGGAKSTFLVQQIIKNNPNINIVVPDSTIVDFKEALLMAYLGYLRVMGETNVISSVTGASHNSIGGAIYIV
jgi:anhydro-N-acetylmuramic acid kinase